MSENNLPALYTATLQLVSECLANRKRVGPGIRIGIAGGTGSGKSTIAGMIRQRLDPVPVEIVRLDQFFKPEDQLPTYYSEFHGESQPDFNTPESLRVNDMKEYCSAISSTGVVILDGHFALYFAEMRDLMDLKCFVEAEIEAMLARRTRRNMAIGYGGGLETITAYNLECVQPRYLEFMRPTMEFADIVIPNGETDAWERDEIVAAICAAIMSRYPMTE